MRVVLANQATWEDLEAIFGTRGAGFADVGRLPKRRVVMRIDYEGATR